MLCLFATHVEAIFNQVGVSGTSVGSLLVVPEPSSLVLALMGLIGLAAFSVQRRIGAQYRADIKPN